MRRLTCQNYLNSTTLHSMETSAANLLFILYMLLKVIRTSSLFLEQFEEAKSRQLKLPILETQSYNLTGETYI
jgi:hypothetical protein